MNEHLSERDLEVAFMALHARTSELVERNAAESPSPITPGSELDLDDRASAPFQTSHTVDGLLGVAVDHLHALTLLVSSTRTLHRCALYTLARAGVETSSTAIWILQPDERGKRVQRTLRVHATDATDATRAIDDLATQPNVTLGERLSHLQRLSAAAGSPFEKQIGSVAATEVVRCANRLVATPPGGGLLAAWRLFSAMAHGRPWAQAAFAETIRVGTGDGFDQVTTRTSLDRVVYAASIASDAVEVGLRLREGRANRVEHGAASGQAAVE